MELGLPPPFSLSVHVHAWAGPSAGLGSTTQPRSSAWASRGASLDPDIADTHAHRGTHTCAHQDAHAQTHVCAHTRVCTHARVPTPTLRACWLGSRAGPGPRGWARTHLGTPATPVFTLPSAANPTCCKLQSWFRGRKESLELAPAAAEEEQEEEALCLLFPRRRAEDGIYHWGEPGAAWTCLPPGATRQPLGQASLAGSPTGGLRVSARRSPGSWWPPSPPPSTAQIYPKAAGCTPASSSLTGNLHAEAVCAGSCGKRLAHPA